MRRWLGRVCLLLALVGTGRTMADEPPEVELIASLTVEQGVLSRNAVRLIFGMRLRTWRDGSPIRVFTLADDDPLHAAFCKELVGLYPHQLRLAWDRLIFSGTGQTPVQLASEAEMLERVASTPGAIGYLQRSRITDRVKRLRVE